MGNNGRNETGKYTKARNAIRPGMPKTKEEKKNAGLVLPSMSRGCNGI